MTISIKHKRGTASALTSANPTLAAGELGFETDTRRFKLGNGSTAWTSLSYVVPYVTATDRLLGRSSAGAGSAEEITCTAFGRSLLDDADAAAARTTLSVQPTASPAFTGTVSAAAANFTGAVTVTSPLRLTGTVAGNNRMLEWQTSGSTRWQVSAHFNAESGSNAGSDLHFTRWSDAGAFLGTPLQIRRDNGLVTCESGLVVQNNQLLVTAGSGSSGSYKPGVAVSGDDDTGIQQVGGADTISAVTGGTERMRIDASGVVTVTSALAGGQLIVATSQTNSTVKYGTFATTHYTNAEEPAIGVWVASDSVNNTVGIGGALGEFNAATLIRIFTAQSNNTTTAGTERVRIDNLGNLRMYTGQIYADDSTSLASPVYSFDGDGNTGIAHPEADAVSICTNGLERVRVNSAGDAQVGFQTVAGLRYLDVANLDSTNSSGAIMRLITRNAANTANASADFVRYKSGLLNILNGDGGPTAFVNGGVEVARFTGTGLGIGVSPSFPLDLVGGNGEQARFTSGATSNDAFIRVREGSGSEDVILGSTLGTGFVGSSTNTAFTLRSNNAPRVWVDAAGEVRVGTNDDRGAFNLQCNGTGVWGAGAYTNGSDERIKEEIKPLGEASSVIAAIQPVTFRYKPEWSNDRSVQPGFIAQQLQEALAGELYLDGVVQQGPEYLSVAYQSLIPLLVKALQESNARIAALEERLSHA